MTFEKLSEEIQNRRFTEFPPCALCDHGIAAPFVVAADGSKLVKCTTCSLVYTSPRFEERKWETYLRADGGRRNIKFTENRLKHGVALDRNIAKQPLNWREAIASKHERILGQLKDAAGDLRFLHDVGCGVGFLMADARSNGVAATGNDLNGYACKVMSDRLGLDARCGSFHEVGLEANSYDAVTMMDYIEHAYHPFRDVKYAFRILRPGGALYVHTFRIDSPAFEQKGRLWDMLSWNHVYHFSRATLARLIKASGFTVVKVIAGAKRSDMMMVAVKPASGD